MKCPNCNKRIQDNSDFCPECGSIIWDKKDSTLSGVDESLHDGYTHGSVEEYEQEHHDEHDNFVAEYSCRKDMDTETEIEAKRQEVRDRIDALRKMREEHGTYGNTTVTITGSKSPMKPKVKIRTIAVNNDTNDFESNDTTINGDKRSESGPSIIRDVVIGMVFMSISGIFGFGYIMASILELFTPGNTWKVIKKVLFIINIITIVAAVIFVIGGISWDLFM